VRRVAGAVVAAALLAGCGGSSTTPTIDPATTVVVSNEALVRPASNICHVTGNILSIATFRVNVTLKWEAFDTTAKVIGTLTLVVNNLNPGESRSFESTGFINGNQGLIDCSKVVNFTRNETDIAKA
jgi:hypothetical protein